MKKISAIFVALLLVATTAITAFAAGINANEQAVLDELKSTVSWDNKTVSLPDSLVNQAENYLNQDDVDLTAEQSATIVAAVKDAANIIKNSKITESKNASQADKESILALVKKAANAIGATATYQKGDGVTVKDADGKVLIKVGNVSLVVKNADGTTANTGSANTNAGVVKTTGANANVAVVVIFSTVAALAVAGGVFFVVKKKA